MSEKLLRLAVITGSVREGRSGTAVADWFVESARSFGQFGVDVIDVAEIDLPLSMTQKPTSGLADLLAHISTRLDSADAFVVITPEYNHSFSAPLKNLIDWHRAEWAAKPVGFVCYGGLSGGLRAVEQLRLVFAELHATTIRDTVSFHAIRDQFDADGKLRTSDAAIPVKVMLEKLAWWATALRAARTQRPYSA